MEKKQTGHISCVNKRGGVKRVSICLKWWQIHSEICTTFIHVLATTLFISPDYYMEHKKLSVDGGIVVSLKRSMMSF